jgi:hypothetical protein
VGGLFMTMTFHISSVYCPLCSSGSRSMKKPKRDCNNIVHALAYCNALEFGGFIKLKDGQGILIFSLDYLGRSIAGFVQSR